MPQGNGGGRGKNGSGSSPRRDDLEEVLRRSQDKLRQVMPGGSGPSFIFLFAAVIKPSPFSLPLPSSSIQTSSASSCSSTG